MNLYFELMKKPVFTLSDVAAYFANIDAARSALKRLIKQNIVVKVRNNLYTCISGETGSPLANKYQIACAINTNAYISHHTAMEYYGAANQVYYDVYVSSKTRFNSFEFDGNKYLHRMSKCELGIDTIPYSGGVRVTNKERTVVDCIKDMDKISGIEETLSNIEVMTKLNEELITAYLDIYNCKFLYQKAGFLLSICWDNLGLSQKFFDHCREKICASKRYLTNETTNGVYDTTWQLIVPEQIYPLFNGDNDD